MPATSTTARFSQWLLAATNEERSSFTVMLHGDPDCVNDSLAAKITSYLDEYDGDANGLWLNATHELLDEIAHDPTHLQRLGLEPHAPATDSPRVLSALQKYGQLVCSATHASPCSSPCSRACSAACCSSASDDGADNTFHAGILRNKQQQTACHVILNPDLIQQDLIPQIISDVFLEWLHTRPSTSRN